MAFEEVFKDHSAKYVDQNAFDGRISHPWLSCFCCLLLQSADANIRMDAHVSRRSTEQSGSKLDW